MVYRRPDFCPELGSDPLAALLLKPTKASPNPKRKAKKKSEKTKANLSPSITSRKPSQHHKKIKKPAPT